MGLRLKREKTSVLVGRNKSMEEASASSRIGSPLFLVDTGTVSTWKRSLPVDGKIEPKKAQTTKGSLSPNRATGHYSLPVVSSEVGSNDLQVLNGASAHREFSFTAWQVERCLLPLSGVSRKE